MKVLLFFILLGFFPSLNFGQENDYLVIDSISIEGNKITKRKIILRELSFSTGDTIPKNEILLEIAASKNNLNNTLLFNFVYMDFLPDEERALVRIEVVERWYIWPIPIFEIGERNLPTWLRDPEFQELNYGVQLDWNNFRGRREVLSLKTRFGYKEQYSLAYTKPNLDRQQKHGFKAVINSFRQREAIYRTADNQPVFLNLEDEYLTYSIAPSLAYTYRPGLYLVHSFSTTFLNNYFATDSLRSFYHGFADDEALQFFAAGYSLRYNRLDYVVYPLSGYFLRLDILRRGLGLIDDFNYGKSYLYLTGSRHDRIAGRFFYENALQIRLTEDEDLPYFFRQALGYETNIRGFEFYVVDGNSYLASVNNLKFQLMKRRSFELKPIPWEQFNKVHFSLFANLFFDFAYVDGSFFQDFDNDLNNRFLWSTGIGVDLLSYYDQVYRLEFTLNSLGQTGFYLHLETPFSRW
jgi:outer membrane protein assembly factor BamA